MKNKSESKQRPGVMFYFDDFRPIADFLSDKQLGVLLRAVMNYAENGEWIAENCDSSVRFALNTMKPKIDRDAERYEDSIWQRKYAVYSRETRKQGKEPIPFEEWYPLRKMTEQRAISSDNG